MEALLLCARWIAPVQFFILFFVLRNHFHYAGFSTGKGYARRADMIRVLTNLGYGNISQSDMLDMFQLFETKEDGLVNYMNFAEYVRENALSQEFSVVEASLKTMFSCEKDLLEVFKAIDVRNEGTAIFTEIYIDVLLIYLQHIHSFLFVSRIHWCGEIERIPCVTRFQCPEGAYYGSHQ